MGDVYAKITLRNGSDIVRARDGHIQEQNIRSVTATAVVDTGAMTLVMGEDLREKLGLVITETDSAILAGGDKAPCGLTEPVEVCWEDRTASIRAWVMPGEKEVLLGVIPLEDMNLIVDPVNETLVRSPKLKRVSGLVRLTGDRRRL